MVEGCSHTLNSNKEYQEYDDLSNTEINTNNII